MWVKRAIQWVQGWTVTLDIKFNHPELYRALTQPLDMRDYTEVGPPGEHHSPNVLAVHGMDGSVYPDKTVCGWDGKPWPCPDSGEGS